MALGESEELLAAHIQGHLSQSCITFRHLEGLRHSDFPWGPHYSLDKCVKIDDSISINKHKKKQV